MKLINPLTLWLALAAAPAVSCDLSIDSAWVREPLPTTTTLAAYGVITNRGDKPLKLTSISSSDFALVEIHETVTVNGLATMRPVFIEVPARSSVEFAPGGKHLMLIRPSRTLRVGDIVELNVTDSSGCTGSLRLPVGNKPAARVDSMPGMKM